MAEPTPEQMVTILAEATRRAEAMMTMLQQVLEMAERTRKEMQPSRHAARIQTPADDAVRRAGAATGPVRLTTPAADVTAGRS